MVRGHNAHPGNKRDASPWFAEDFQVMSMVAAKPDRYNAAFSITDRETL